MNWNLYKISDFSSYGNHIDSFSSATDLMRSVQVMVFFFFNNSLCTNEGWFCNNSPNLFIIFLTLCELMMYTDDAMAIFVALRSPEVEVIGLTTIYGNVYTTLATRNALHLV